MNRLNGRLLVFSTLLLVLSAGLVSFFALQRFQADLSPEMLRKADVVGESVKAVMLKVVDYGVPLNRMTGVEDYLALVQADNPEIIYSGIANAQGNILFQRGKLTEVLTNKLATRDALDLAARTGVVIDRFLITTVPVKRHGEIIAYIYLGQDAQYVQEKTKEILYDILTVLVVSGLIALELLRFVMAFSITTPLGLIRAMLDRVKKGDFSTFMPSDAFGGLGRLNTKFNLALERVNDAYNQLRIRALKSPDASPVLQPLTQKFKFSDPQNRQELSAAVVDYIRWPFFLLIFSDSLSLSFFPVYVDTLYSPSLGLSRQVLSGLPISVFMLVWALSMPWAGGWVDKVGFRRAFITGSILTTVGLLLTGGAQSIYDLLLWRSITAIGYGLVFITGQSYIAKHTPPEQRTKGMATFLASFFSGSLAGAAIGGILADRIGYQMTFFLSAFLGIASAFFVYQFLVEKRETEGVAKKKLSLADFSALFKNKRFVVITFLAAVPAKIALAGFLYYTAPLYMKSLGSNQAATGRVMMAYGLAIILLSPTIARMADKLGVHKKFVGLGGYASALSMFVMYFMDSMLGIVLSITLLGIAHAIGVSPQLALINDVCKDVVKVVGAATTSGIFRLMERLGNVSGPIISGALIAVYGFKGAFLGIGIICLVSISIFSCLIYWFDQRDNKLHASVTPA